MTAEPKPHSTDNALTQTDRHQEALAQNENPMPSTLISQHADEFETTLSPADQALLLQLTNGLAQRSAATPSFSSEAILRQITGGNPSGVGNTANPDKNRKRKLAAFTVAVAGLAATPFVVRPTITAIRGKEKPVVVATTSSAMPKFIVGGLNESDIQTAYISQPKALQNLETKQLRFRRDRASIDISTFGGYSDYQGPNGEKATEAPIQIGSQKGKRIVFPTGTSNEMRTQYEWSVPEGELSASAEGISEPELLTILGSITRTPFKSGAETIVTVGNRAGFALVGEATDPVWNYFITYGPKRRFNLDVSPTNSLAEDTFTRAKKVKGTSGREYAVGARWGGRSYLTWFDPTGAVLHLGLSGTEDGVGQAITDEQFDELVKLADSVREIDDATFTRVVASRRFTSNINFSDVPKKAPMANVLDGTVDGVAWKLTAGETPLEKECEKVTFSGPEKPFSDCIPENPKGEFISLGAANVGSSSPKTVVFGVVKDTLEIIRVRNSAGDVIGEDFSIENGYLDGRAFAIELPTNLTGELTIEGYSYDDDVADSLPETQFLPNDAKPLASKTVSVK
jgi:hypothetical protein